MRKTITVLAAKTGVKALLFITFSIYLLDKGKCMLLIDGNPQINLTSAVSELLTNAQYTTGALIWQNFLSKNTNSPVYKRNYR